MGSAGHVVTNLFMLHGITDQPFRCRARGTFLPAPAVCFRNVKRCSDHVRMKARGPHETMLSLPYTFVLMNWAAVAGLYFFVTGKKDVWLKSKLSHSHKN